MSYGKGHVAVFHLLLATLALLATGCDGDDAAPAPGDVTACTDDYGPRQLRLLTRREYNRTVADLLGEVLTESSCESDVHCNIAAESCIAGSCQADPCNLITFQLDAGGQSYSSVHIAGSFNNWAGTLADGGWPLSYVPELDAYIAKRTLPDGQHSYKVVVDEQDWLTDPSNPSQEPDGFGGFNSLLTISCADAPPPVAGTTPFNPAADFPVESRPEHYNFDNNAAAGLVTAVHVEHFLRAADTLAKMALVDTERLLGCAASQGDETCIRQFVERFGRRAYRRQLSSAEVNKYAALTTGQGTQRQGLSVLLRVMLSSPYFLYRSEIGTPQDGGYARLSGYEIASALSYSFWGTMPDDVLLNAAAAGELNTPAGIAQQANRLLDDERSHETVAVFAMQWLGIERVVNTTKNSNIFPQWNSGLAAAMAEETRRLVEHVVFSSSGRYEELLLADYSFVNDELANHYSVDGAAAAGFTKRILPTERQAGILGHGSVLASYAHSDQTSPIRRGLFVRENLLCQDLGTPPANAGGVPPVDPNATTRERFAQHSADPACSYCHRHIDALGFGFERFDAAGQYRETENGEPIDASGEMNDVERLGESVKANFSSLRELATIIAESESAHRCFTRNAYRFSLGGFESAHNTCTVGALQQSFLDSGGNIRQLLIYLTQAPSFVRRK